MLPGRERPDNCCLRASATFLADLIGVSTKGPTPAKRHALRRDFDVTLRPPNMSLDIINGSRYNTGRLPGREHTAG